MKITMVENEIKRTYDDKNRILKESIIRTETLSDGSILTDSFTNVNVKYNESKNTTIKISKSINGRKQVVTTFHSKNIRKTEEYNKDGELYHEITEKIIYDEIDPSKEKESLTLYAKHRHIEESYIYDENDNLLTIIYTNKQTKSKEYVCYKYDDHNNIIEKYNNVRNLPEYTIRYTYHVNGQIRTKYKTYKDKEYLYIKYDMFGRIIYSSCSTGFCENIRYDEKGRIIYKKTCEVLEDNKCIKYITEYFVQYQENINSDGNKIITEECYMKQYEYDFKKCNTTIKPKKSYKKDTYILLNGVERLINSEGKTKDSITEYNAEYSEIYTGKYEMTHSLKTQFNNDKTKILSTDEQNIFYKISNNNIIECQYVSNSVDSEGKKHGFTEITQYEYDKNNNIICEKECTKYYPCKNI